MRTTAILAVGAMLLTAGALRLRTYLHGRDAGAGHLAVAASCAGVAILLNAPLICRWSDHHLFYRPNISILLSHVLTVIGAGAAGEMVAALRAATGRRGRAARLSAQAALISSMAICFAHGDPAREDPYFFEHFHNDPALRPYWCLFFGAALVQLSYVAARTVRHARDDDQWLGRGLLLIGAGSASVAAFVATRAAELAAPAVSSAVDPATLALLVAGGFLIATGVLTPQLGLRSSRAAARRQLHPLWEAVTTDCPHVRANRRKPTLYRSVIEIQDALADARSRHAADDPLLRALGDLPPRSADEFDLTVRDLLGIAARATPATSRVRVP